MHQAKRVSSSVDPSLRVLKQLLNVYSVLVFIRRLMDIFLIVIFMTSSDRERIQNSFCSDRRKDTEPDVSRKTD